MKIIHLSDLHIGHENCIKRCEVVIDTILRYIDANPSTYVVVITGDIVDWASKKKNLDDAVTVIRKLTGKATVLPVPGNHDYYNWAHVPNKKYGQEFNKTFFGSSHVDYPRVDQIGNTVFLGLNSMEGEMADRDHLWGAQGKIGDDQLKGEDGLEQHLSTYETDEYIEHIVVYLHHHPFNPIFQHELRDADELKGVLRTSSKVKALLFGHNHRGWKWNGMWEIERCFDAGSATRKNNSPGYHRIIDLDMSLTTDLDGDFHPTSPADR